MKRKYIRGFPMFGMSFSEIALVFIIALLIFGPKQIPPLAHQLGKFIIGVRRYFEDLKRDIYDKSGLSEIRNIKEEINGIYSNIRQNMNIDNKVEYNKIFDRHSDNDTPIYFQPELDFDREPELFDEIDINESRPN